MEQETLGKGLNLPIRINQRGGLAVASYEEKVRQSILTILSTAKGERVMRPEFGCDLQAYVFSPLDTTTLTLIKSVVREALVRWEARIQLNDVNVVTDPLHDGQLRISVSYTVRATNVRNNLVYLFPQQTGT